MKNDDTLKHKNQFENKIKNLNHDEDYEFRQKWQIGRARFP